jgi:hypothetical protein
MKNIKKIRRSKDKIATVKAMQKQLELVEAEAQKAIEQEKQLLKETEEAINLICENEDLFCGVILTHDDVLQIVDLAIKTKENIKIPFKLYFNE